MCRRFLLRMIDMLSNYGESFFLFFYLMLWFQDQDRKRRFQKQARFLEKDSCKSWSCSLSWCITQCVDYFSIKPLKIFKKEMKEDTNTVEDIAWTWIRKFNIKMAILHKPIFRCNTISVCFSKKIHRMASKCMKRCSLLIMNM